MLFGRIYVVLNDPIFRWNFFKVMAFQKWIVEAPQYALGLLVQEPEYEESIVDKT